jgi:hypothetical protein
MAESKRIDFEATISWLDMPRLYRNKVAAMAKTDIDIVISYKAIRFATKVHIEINGDEGQALAFKRFVERFALQPPV